MLSSTLKKILAVFDTYALIGLSVFLLLFIPLYPKLPLFEIIPGYLVKFRIEDLVVILTGVVWLLQIYRNRITWKSTFLGAVTLYAGIGLLSVFSGIFLLQTIPLEPLHIGKSLFHFFRYLEYFSVFFFMFGAITSLKQSKVILVLLSLVTLIVTIYAVGQLKMSWPVFSTMNREFSKGTAQVLGEGARVQSTFAGHYDMAAFLVILLPFLVMTVFTHPRWLFKAWFAIVTLGGTWLLIESGSKLALVAGITGIYVSFLLLIKERVKIYRSLITLTLIGAVVCGLGISYVAFNLQNPDLTRSLETYKNSALVAKLPPLSAGITKTLRFLANQQTGTVRQPIDAQNHISLSNDAPVWSENTLKYGLSLGIRLDTLWPQAFQGLSRNMYLGTGYGTLNKTANSNFVEADSTDNNLLRTLGETGLLGFMTFYGIIWLLTQAALLKTDHQNWVIRVLSLGFIGATIGLLIDAVMIDVFVASKVAFTYWALAGLTVKSIYLSQPQLALRFEQTHLDRFYSFFKRFWPLLFGIAVLIFLVHRNPNLRSSGILNFTADPDATSALTTVSCWKQLHQWQLCRPETTLASPTSYLYGGYLWLFSLTGNLLSTYYYANLMLAILSLSGLFWLTNLWFKKQWLIATALIFQTFIYFTTSYLFSAVDANLVIPLIIVVLVAGTKLRLVQTRRWQVVTGFIALCIITIAPSIPLSTIGYVFSPLAVLLLVSGLKWLSENHWPLLPPHLQTITLFLFFSGGSCIILLSPIPTTGQKLIQEYRGTTSESRVQNTRVTNDFFSHLKLNNDETASDSATVLTTANPYFFDFYRTQNYTLLPLSLTQPLLTNAPQIWGNHNYSSITELVKTEHTRNHPVYVSDFEVSDSKGLTEFSTLKKNFDLNLVALGCDETCNLYHIPASPVITYQTTAENQPAYSFVIYNHHYDLNDQKLAKSMTDLQSVFTTEFGASPAFMITTGKSSGHQTFYNPKPSTKPFPVFFSRDSRNQKDTGEFYSLRTTNSAFLFLNQTSDGVVDESQKIALYNAILDLENAPEIKNIFLISHRDVRQDPLYRQRLLPKLQQLQNKKLFVVAGDFESPNLTNPGLFYEFSKVDNATYMASVINGLANDVYLHIAVDAEADVTITPKTRVGTTLEPLGTYGNEYWRPSLPDFQKQPTAPSPSYEKFPLKYKGIVALMIGGILSALYTFRQVLEKRIRLLFLSLNSLFKYT